MTVGELIAELRKYPPETEVRINYEDWAWADIQSVDGPEENFPHVTISHSCSFEPSEEAQKEDE